MPRWSRCAIAPEAKTIHRLLETDPRTGAFRRTEEAGAEPAIARSVPTRCDPDWEEFAPDSPLEGNRIRTIGPAFRSARPGASTTSTIICRMFIWTGSITPASSGLP
jgi:hypothetical protein